MFYIRYIGALFYDGIILTAVFFFFTALCLISHHGIAIPPASLWYQMSLLLLFSSYYFLSYQRGGQTVGMRAWHLMLVSTTSRVSKQQIIMRFFLMIPACLCGILCFNKPQQLLKNWTKSYIIIAKSTPLSARLRCKL